MIVALVLLSAFLHALWNALLRLERDKDRSLIAAIVVATLFAATVAGVRWQLGGVSLGSWRGVGFTLVAGVFEASYFATLARAMELGKLGVVYTISRGGAVVVVWPLSIVLFAEAATVPAMAGSVLVLAGIASSGLSAGSGEQAGRPAAIGWSVACAMSIAGYHLAYKAALEEGVNPSACFALSLAASVTINGVRLATRRHGHGQPVGALVRARWPKLLLMGFVCGGSFLILMEALARGGSGYVLTLRNTSVLFAAAMAWFIGDRPRRGELAGAAMVAMGAALMAW